MNNINLATGVSNFAKIINDGNYFVDKSLLIKEIIDDRAEVILINRPRRFGKTLNLSMLEHFFAKEVRGIETKELFNNLQIIRAGENYLQHQGRYPVIYISFKDIIENNFDDAYKQICEIIIALFDQYEYLGNSEHLSRNNTFLFNAILNRQFDKEKIKSSLKTLCSCLYSYYKVKPILLIDEYDAPIQNSYINNYYEEMVGFFRGFLGFALKDNPYITKGILTGVLKVSKESLFSGLNNLESYSVLNDQYSNYFGFTEEEVQEIIRLSKLDLEYEKVKEWYNGYKISHTTVYNPWSITRLIKSNGLFGYYWLNTSGNELLKDLIIRSPLSFKENLLSLLTKDLVNRQVDDQLVFSDIDSDHKRSIWSLFLMSGYLTVANTYFDEISGISADLVIPNLEVRYIYSSTIEKWLSQDQDSVWYTNFISSLLSGQIEKFADYLAEIIIRIASVHDMAREPEAFYQGIILGLTASLYNRSNYTLSSNRESGKGKYDFLILSHDYNKPSIIFEFKSVKCSEKENLSSLLENEALEALKQIEKRSYDDNINNELVIKIGIAFCGKEFVLRYVS